MGKTRKTFRLQCEKKCVENITNISYFGPRTAVVVEQMWKIKIRDSSYEILSYICFTWIERCSKDKATVQIWFICHKKICL